MSDLCGYEVGHGKFHCLLPKGHIGEHDWKVQVTRTYTDADLAEARRLEASGIHAAMRILIEGIPGAAFNAATEDYPELARLVGEVRRKALEETKLIIEGQREEKPHHLQISSRK